MSNPKFNSTKKLLALVTVLTAVSLTTACSSSGGSETSSESSSSNSTIAVSEETSIEAQSSLQSEQQSETSQDTSNNPFSIGKLPSQEASEQSKSESSQEVSRETSEQSKSESSQEVSRETSEQSKSESSQEVSRETSEQSKSESSQEVSHETSQQSKPEPSQSESSQSEPSRTEVSSPEPSQPEPSHAEPSSSEPSQTEPPEIEPSFPEEKERFEGVDIKGVTYYQVNDTSLWTGEYHQDDFYIEQSIYPDVGEVVSYEKYIQFINEANDIIDEKKEGGKLTAYYSDKDSNYIILANADPNSWCDMYLYDCTETNDSIIIYGSQRTRGLMASGSGYFVAIPTKLPVGTEVDFRQCYYKTEIYNLKNYGTIMDPHDFTVDKPIIYLYPTEDTQVSVKLDAPGRLTCSYPKYNNGWNVLAQPDGTLTDLDTGRELYSLYYECANNTLTDDFSEGFVVKGEDSAAFLEDKLSVLGLTPREAEEFIVYWLPKLEVNKYNIIRFATAEEIEEVMPITVSPSPESIIRILMVFKGIDTPVSVPAQKLETPERTGFTVVEWGGCQK